MKSKNTLTAIAAIALVFFITFFLQMKAMASEEPTDKTQTAEQAPGNVYAAVFHGRHWLGAEESAEIVYNALISNKLPGFKTDTENIHIVGNGRISTLTQETVNETLDSAFSKSTENDMGIFYYAGHTQRENHKDTQTGETSQRISGLYFGEITGFTYTYEDLFSKLSKYRFKKIIIIIDACYAGSCIETLENLVENGSISDDFTQKTIIMASTGRDLQDEFNEEEFFTFTTGLISSSRALYYPMPNERPFKWTLTSRCDIDSNGIVSTYEAFNGAKTSKSELYLPSTSSKLSLNYYLYLLSPIYFDNTIHSPEYYPKEQDDGIPLFQFQYLEMDNKTMEIFIGTNNSRKLVASKFFLMEDTHKIRWTSDDDSIAVVDQEGNVTGVSEGTTNIVAHLDTSNGVECIGAEAKCEVTVRKVITDIENENYQIYVGEDLSIVHTVVGQDSKTVWTSSNETVVTVNSEGKIEGHRPGHATITLDANGKKDSALVDVMEPFIEADNISLDVGESEQIEYKIYGPKEDIAFSSSDKKIASVDKNGIITANEAGEVQITLKAANIVTTTITVTVQKQDLTMEGVGLAYGHYEGVKPQGDGAIPCELDLNEDETFRLYCYFDLFSSSNSTPHTYKGTYTIDRINEKGEAILAFESDTKDFEMTLGAHSLYHENFFFFID